MLNTHKLLYILPDVAYVTELLPAKKPNTFSIQSFRQINGEFMDDEVFITKNILKLFKKLKGDEYHLILPDFLFTNTILNVNETSDTKIKEYINETLLPQLNLSDESHELETFVLTEFKGVAKVQLSAVEKSLLAPVRVAADENEVKITAISPLSWTIKSVVSLEPSITVLQIGSQLYTAQQYIGVDQATITPVSDTDAIIETIKTLKGAEPSIQTVYLLTNEKVEQELAESLSDTIPLQQLSTAGEEDSKMPSYVQHIIESSMRTLSIEEYPVPRFAVGTASKEEQQEYLAEVVEDLDEEEQDDVEETSTPKTKPPQSRVTDDDEDDSEALPAPTKPVVAAATATTTTTAAAAIQPSAATTPLERAHEALKTEVDATTEADQADGSAEKSTDSINTEDNQPKTETPSVKSATPPAAAVPKSTAKSAIMETDSDDDDVDLSQFAGHTAAATTPEVLEEKAAPVAAPAEPPKKKEVIKNSSGIGAMLRMIFITLAVFSLTVAIGVGVGLGLLSWTSQDQTAQAPSPTPAATTTPEPTPTPTPEPEVAVEDLKILVVNATTKAGYAGTIKAALDDAGYGQVTAANAKGEYETGNYVLMSEENAGLVAKLSEDTDLDLEYSDEVEAEDAQGQYDAVVVLAE